MQLTYPGVYVQEIPSSVRPIATVSTSVAAFVDAFPMGDTDVAIQIFGMADFERVFGGVSENSPASYQISQFFLNGGPSAWVVRVAPGGVAATVQLLDTNTTPLVYLVATAVSPGTWGNSVRISIDPVLKSAGGDQDPNLFNLTVTRYSGTSPTTSEKYSGLSQSTFATQVNASSQLISIESKVVTDPATPPLSKQTPAFNGTYTTTALGPVDTAKVNNALFKVNDSTATLTLPASLSSPAPTSITPDQLRGMLEIAIRAAASSAHPELAGVRVSLVGSQLFIRIDPRTTGYNPTAALTFVQLSGSPPPNFVNLNFADIAFDKRIDNVQEYALGDTTATTYKSAGAVGSDGGAPDATALIGNRDHKTGIYALENADLFNILCLPVVSETLSGGQATAVMAEALAYCTERRAMYIVDIPADTNTPVKIQNWVQTNSSFVQSENSAIYFPRVELTDPADNYAVKSYPNSGTIAGIWAKTDNDRGVWKAPAGIDAVLRGVTSLDYLMSDGENGVLNQLGIDCLRNFPVYGQVVWGARTMEGADAMASQWKYIPIRRLALMIEESLFRGTKWVVFEPNDEPLWAKIRQNVGAFMTQLFRQGAFQGSTPDKAFFVKCDGETTTAADRNAGVVNIEVGFAPLKPAEFVVLKISQIPDLV
ncbi:MAG: phage tail sheath subtilisin-like domain-containing protein [Kofleriaceae bacterium]